SRKAEIQDKCSFHAVNPAILPSLLTDEEAFLFLGRWLLDQVGGIDNSEIFVVYRRSDPAYESAHHRSELIRACRFLEEKTYPHFSELMVMARRYCRRAL